MKKVLCILTVLALLMSCVCVSVSAADGDKGTYYNPYRMKVGNATATQITLPVDGSDVYVFVNDSDNTTLKVEETTSTNYKLYYCHRPVTIDKNGKAELVMFAEAEYFVLMNTSDTEVTVTLRLYPSDGTVIKGTADKPEEITPVADGENFTVSAEAKLIKDNDGYHYNLNAPLTGKMTAKISATGQEGLQWTYTIDNITSVKYGEITHSQPGDTESVVEIDVSKDDNLHILVATYDPANEFYNPAGTVKVELTFSPAPADTEENGGNDSDNNGGSDTGSTGTDTGNGNTGDTDGSNTGSNSGSSDTGSDNGNTGNGSGSSDTSDNNGSDTGSGTGDDTDSTETEEPEENYYFDADHPIAEGEGEYPLSGDKEYTVFSFTPEKKGKYTFTATDARLGIVSYNGMWVTVIPSETTITSNSFDWTCNGEGQEIWVAVIGEGKTASIKVDFEEVEEKVIPKEYYENKHTPVAFTYDGDASLLQYVDTEDSVVDKAVLGSDGYYHLNTADGPILYADLNDELMSLEDANSYGQLKWFVYENDVHVKTIDYTLAMIEYLDKMDQENGLYPLTEDLIEIYDKVGGCHDWYGADGWVGGELEDAWMFACYYYVPGADAPQNNGNEGTTNGTENDQMNNETVTSPQTGDEMVYIAIVAVAAIGAFALLTVMRKRRFNK